MSPPPIPPFTEHNSDTYAFLGWVWTCTVHDSYMVSTRGESYTPTEPPFELIAVLGENFLGQWRYDLALRNGWELLDEECREFAREALLPRCSGFMRGALLGEIRSKG